MEGTPALKGALARPRGHQETLAPGSWPQVRAHPRRPGAHGRGAPCPDLSGSSAGARGRAGSWGDVEGRGPSPACRLEPSGTPGTLPLATSGAGSTRGLPHKEEVVEGDAIRGEGESASAILEGRRGEGTEKGEKGRSGARGPGARGARAAGAARAGLPRGSGERRTGPGVPIPDGHPRELGRTRVPLPGLRVRRVPGRGMGGREGGEGAAAASLARRARGEARCQKGVCERGGVGGREGRGGDGEEGPAWGGQNGFFPPDKSSPAHSSPT